ncbi:MAG: hypothetical protein ACR2PG_24960 [Hyphomicrobiaceae bacterium]
MLHLQLQFWNTLSESTVAYLDAYVSAMEAHANAQAAAVAMHFDAIDGSCDSSHARSDATTSAAVFKMPEVPRSGKSWYRAPIENPTLAFWDAMWRPWRTYQTHDVWTNMTGMTSMAPLNWLRNLQSGPSAFAFGSMSEMWANGFPTATNAASLWQSPSDMVTIRSKRASSVGSQQFEPPFGFAVATVRFPDATEVTMTVPVAALPFMVGYPNWAKK